MIKIGGLHHKIEAALADPLFIMGEQRLGYPQLLGSRLLAEPLLFAQQSQNPGKALVDHTRVPRPLSNFREIT